MKDYKRVLAMIVMGTIIAAGMFAIDMGNGLSFNGFGLAGVSLAENQADNLAFGLDNSFGLFEAAYGAERGGAKILFATVANNWVPIVWGFPYAYVNFFQKILTISVGNNYEPLWATGNTDPVFTRWWDYLSGIGRANQGGAQIKVDLNTSTQGLIMHNFVVPGIRFELAKIEQVKGLRLAWYLGIPGATVEDGRYSVGGAELGDLFDNMFVAAGYESEKFSITGGFENANTESGIYANLDTNFSAFKLNAVLNWVFTDPGFFRATPTFVFTNEKLQKMELYARGDVWIGSSSWRPSANYGGTSPSWNLIDADTGSIRTDPTVNGAFILGAEAGFSYLLKNIKLNISAGTDNIIYFTGNGLWAKAGTGFDISENLKFELYDKLGKIGAVKNDAGSTFDNIVQLNMMWRF
ncbi:hypothetical protein FACS189485_09450 [Spirochaetia bacterium]|nr:hypothetical protein FACS189485_09450 [Spirochaetia bacterium]